MGAGVASSSLSVLVVIRCCLVVVRSCHRSLLSVVRCCPSFDAVRLRSCPSRVVKSFCVAGVAFGDGCRQRWCCRISWVGVCPVVAGGARGSSLSFAGRCVLCASLLPLLGGCRVVLGGCSRFWMLGRRRLCDVTWERRGDEADVGCHWAVCRGHGRHRWRGGCSLKKPSHNGVTLPSCSTRT